MVLNYEDWVTESMESCRIKLVLGSPLLILMGLAPPVGAFLFAPNYPNFFLSPFFNIPFSISFLNLPAMIPLPSSNSSLVPIILLFFTNPPAVDSASFPRENLGLCKKPLIYSSFFFKT